MKHTDLSQLSVEELVSLGGDLVCDDDEIGAQEAFRAALERGPGPQWGFAACRLAERLGRQDDEARRLYEMVLAANGECAADAAVGLAGIAKARGDAEGAKSMYRVAMAYDQPGWSSLAAWCLGMRLESERDLAGAIAAYRGGVSSHDPDNAPLNAAWLATLLHALGDHAGAEAVNREMNELGLFRMPVAGSRGVRDPSDARHPDISGHRVRRDRDRR